MPAFVAKTRGAWLRQAREAQERIEHAGAQPGTTLAEMAALDYEAFCLLVEAMYALGVPVAQDMLDRAQMRPVEEVL